MSFFSKISSTQQQLARLLGNEQTAAPEKAKPVLLQGPAALQPRRSGPSMATKAPRAALNKLQKFGQSVGLQKRSNAGAHVAPLPWGVELHAPSVAMPAPQPTRPPPLASPAPPPTRPPPLATHAPAPTRPPPLAAHAPAPTRPPPLATHAPAPTRPPPLATLRAQTQPLQSGPTWPTAVGVPQQAPVDLGLRTSMNPLPRVRQPSVQPSDPRNDGPDLQALRQAALQSVAAFRSERTGQTGHEAIMAAFNQPAPTLRPSGRLPVGRLPPDAKYTNVASMMSAFVGEETGEMWGTKVVYLDERQRAQMEITVKDGKLYEASGKLFDTRNATTVFGGNEGRAIFVMAPNGKLYASLVQARGKIHHSSLLAGRPVAGAGEMEVRDGELKRITLDSGHYQPTAEQLDQVVDSLISQGMSPTFEVDKTMASMSRRVAASPQPVQPPSSQAISGSAPHGGSPHPGGAPAH